MEDNDTKEIEPKESLNETDYIVLISRINYQRWYVHVYIKIKEEYVLESIALVDSGADQNSIREGLIPTKYFEKTKEELCSANGAQLVINYKLSNAKICNNQVCFK